MAREINRKMQESEFRHQADQILIKIIDLIESQDQEGLIDIDFQGDIINLTTNRGIFVINKHSAAKEIWLASPISGPYHFALKEGKWISRSGVELFTILQTELGVKFE